MSFTATELRILALHDRTISVNETKRAAKGRPRKLCQPLTGDVKKDARRIYRREWMRNHRRKSTKTKGMSK